MLMMALLLAAAAPAAVPQACHLYRAGDDLAATAGIAAQLDAGWPPAWASRHQLAAQTMSDADLAGPLALLACVASWPGQQERVLRKGRALFTSRVHGRAALDALDHLARNPGLTFAERAAASRLRAEVVHATGRDPGTLD
jgi:hypothetical protein